MLSKSILPSTTHHKVNNGTQRLAQSTPANAKRNPHNQPPVITYPTLNQMPPSHHQLVLATALGAVIRTLLTLLTSENNAKSGSSTKNGTDGKSASSSYLEAVARARKVYCEGGEDDDDDDDDDDD